ncbi:MAG: hypothetical protein IPF79_04990 [Ignavibacteria bacterium]|nr:hypothetical protein [Ignavibacteria bacterium]
MRHHHPPLLGAIAVCMIALAACDTPSNELSAQQQHTGNSDTSIHRLTFTSGIRAILQDAKGNVWFGSHSEGAAMYDGSRLRYYTTSNGLTDMSIRSINEDAQGGIWFEGARGFSRSMNGVITPFVLRAGRDPEPWSSAHWSMSLPLGKTSTAHSGSATETPEHGSTTASSSRITRSRTV